MYGLEHPEKSAQTLKDMERRLGLEIENDGRAYTVICFALLDRIERLEARLELYADTINRRLQALEEKGKPHPHWTDMPR